MAVRQLRTSAVPSSAPAPRRSARNASQTPSLHATPEKGIRTTRRQVRGSSVEQADDHNDAESDHELESGTVTRLTRREYSLQLWTRLDLKENTTSLGRVFVTSR